MIHVTCAIVVHQEKILICQRSPDMRLPLKWEFPGGKIEEGESLQECLIREIHEELSLRIRVLEPLEKVIHHYPDFSICLYPFISALLSSPEQLHAAEHAQAIWVSREELPSYDWAEADVPVVQQILNLNNKNNGTRDL